ncbi:MAG: translation initiation factor IF-2 [Clostridiales bacterium]|jgi:translation initiation factor IF-2|nr:translation initiation factor IF-2 [Clostridiales bacterium]
MSEINVYVTTKKVKQNATDLLDKVKVLQRDMDEYIGLINKLENTLQQQAKEMEEKRKVEELKAAEKKRQARKAEKGEKADAAPTAIPAEPPADKPAKKQFVRNDTRKKTFRQSNKIIDEFLAQPPVFSQKEKKADGTKGEAHTRTYQETPKGKERKSKKDFWEDENPAIINKLRRTKGKRSSKEAQKEQQKPPERKKAITMGEFITVKELSEKIGIQVSEIIKRLMKLGVLATINQELDYDTAALVASEFDIELEKKAVKSFEEILEQEDVEDAPDDLRSRAPVVTVMGHVDHGKTSLLDAIRNSRVTEQEAGGITQHIGAYMVDIDGKAITFIDTPGHEAFSSMRARGAKVTDIAVLVVAANDGVMPQTIEAINHAKEAGVPIIVAINKMDIPGVNPDRIKQGLAENGLLVEEWGGDTIAVPISALKRQGIDTLLEMILLVAEMQELKANPNRLAKGTIVEAQLDKGRGPVATVLVQNGTLKVGDPIVAGTASGRVRAMIDHNGKRVKSAGPSVPVEVLGFSEVPEAGDILYAVGDDKLARQVAEERKEKIRDTSIRSTARASLDDLFSQIEQGELKDLNIIIKADVQGTAEAVRQALERLSNDKVRVRVIHSGVGTINESDVILASASNAIIIGFNVRPPGNVVELAEKEKIDIRLYRIIYNAIEDVEAAMKGMLEPTYREVVLGFAEVRNTFRISSVGTVAGCYITNGKVTRNANVRIVRDGIVVHEGTISSLKRFKDDVREVAAGYECGIGISNFNDIKEGDIIEAFIEEEIQNE